MGKKEKKRPCYLFRVLETPLVFLLTLFGDLPGGIHGSHATVLDQKRADNRCDMLPFLQHGQVSCVSDDERRLYPVVGSSTPCINLLRVDCWAHPILCDHKKKVHPCQLSYFNTFKCNQRSCIPCFARMAYIFSRHEQKWALDPVKVAWGWPLHTCHQSPQYRCPRCLVPSQLLPPEVFTCARMKKAVDGFRVNPAHSI